MRGLIGNIFLGKPVQTFYLFTNENLIYIMDGLVKNNAVVTTDTVLDQQGVNMNTRYLNSNAFINTESKYNVSANRDKKNIPNFLLYGNAYFQKISNVPYSSASYLANFDNIINPWTSQLSHYDDQLYDTIINANNLLTYNKRLSELMFLSNYGFTLSPFNVYPNKLNSLIFNIAGVMQVPTFLPAYIGLLVYALRNDIDPNSTFNTKTIKDFFTTGAGKNLDSSGVFIFADLHDIDKYLSEQDKDNYVSEFDIFESSNYNNILTGVYDMYDKVKKDVAYKSITDTAAVIIEKQKTI
jgi:hypothetical protein